jgi:NADH pyrophosphatase NudC (nudix superfamily)
MEDTDSLRNLFDAIAEAKAHRISHQAVHITLQSLPTVPTVKDCGPLEELIAEMAESGADVGRHKRAVSTSARALAKADKALRQWAEDNRICPTCGAALDPERLINAAASGLKGHAHG